MIINPKNEREIQAFIARPSSSLLVLGDTNDGVREIVISMTTKLLKGENKNNLVTLEPEPTKGITIEQIRELRTQLMTKSSGDGFVARVGIIWEFNTASVEAQNALLKLLEEPVNKTLLILQTSTRSAIVSTVLSRTQTIRLLPITKQQAKISAASRELPEAEIEKLYLLSNGKSKLYSELIENEKSALFESVNTAKLFLKASVFDRLTQYSVYMQKNELLALTKSLEQIAAAGMHMSTLESIERWKHIATEARHCRQLLEQNVLTKLVYTRLCVSI